MQNARERNGIIRGISRNLEPTVNESAIESSFNSSVLVPSSVFFIFSIGCLFSEKTHQKLRHVKRVGNHFLHNN